MMLNPPKSKKEAEKIRYGSWSGLPKGHPYNPDKCAWEVWSGHMGMTVNQCSRRNGHGPDKLYCKQHFKQFLKQTTSRSVEPGKTWKCECGGKHELTGYVCAHWDDKLKHTCNCGRKHCIESGTVWLEGES